MSQPEIEIQAGLTSGSPAKMREPPHRRSTRWSLSESARHQVRYNLVTLLTKRLITGTHTSRHIPTSHNRCAFYGAAVFLLPPHHLVKGSAILLAPRRGRGSQQLFVTSRSVKPRGLASLISVPSPVLQGFHKGTIR